MKIQEDRHFQRRLAIIMRLLSPPLVCGIAVAMTITFNTEILNNIGVNFPSLKVLSIVKMH